MDFAWCKTCNRDVDTTSSKVVSKCRGGRTIILGMDGISHSIISGKRAEVARRKANGDPKEPEDKPEIGILETASPEETQSVSESPPEISTVSDPNEFELYESQIFAQPVLEPVFESQLQTGIVYKFDPEKKYLLIDADCQTVFASHDNLDAPRGHFCLYDNQLVSFLWHEDQTGFYRRARNVSLLNPPILEEMEISTVVRLVKDAKGYITSGFAQRDCRCPVYFQRDDIVTEGINTLSIGSQIYHGIKRIRKGKRRHPCEWRAIEVEIVIPADPVPIATDKTLHTPQANAARKTDSDQEMLDALLRKFRR